MKNETDRSKQSETPYEQNSPADEVKDPQLKASSTTESSRSGDGYNARSHGADTTESVFRTIRLVLLAFSALFAILIALFSFLGWRTVSDVQSTVESTVDRRVGAIVSGENKEMSLYSEQISILTSDFKRVRQEVTRIGGGVTTVSENLELSLRGQTDPVGDYFRLEEELQQDPSKRWECRNKEECRSRFPKTAEPKFT